MRTTNALKVVGAGEAGRSDLELALDQAMNNQMAFAEKVDDEFARVRDKLSEKEMTVAVAARDYHAAIHDYLAAAFAALPLPEWDGRIGTEAADHCVDVLVWVVRYSRLSGVITKKHIRQFVGRKYHVQW